jgi:hypothetical protein
MIDPDPKKPGPDPNRLNIDESEGWEKAVNRALRKRRPKDGWPKPDKRSKEDDPQKDG